MATLITGGTGFIGAEVVRLLLDRGEQRPVVFHVSGNTRRLDDVADQADLRFLAIQRRVAGFVLTRLVIAPAGHRGAPIDAHAVAVRAGADIDAVIDVREVRERTFDVGVRIPRRHQQEQDHVPSRLTWQR